MRDGLENPRLIRTAPNGDLFVAESRANRIRVFRDGDGDGKPEVNEVFATGLNRPFGIAFYPPGAEPEVRLRRQHRLGRPLPLPERRHEGARTAEDDRPADRSAVRGGGHWTRDLEFSPDGKTLFVSVGSRSNVDDPTTTPREAPRRRSWRSTPTARTARLRLGHPQLPSAWRSTRRPASSGSSVNERDALGDHLVPDYITHVEEGGFYGWPWYYLGPTRTRATRASTPS